MTTTQQLRIALLTWLTISFVVLALVSFAQTPPLPPAPASYDSEVMVVHFSDDGATWGTAHWVQVGTNWVGSLTLETNWPYGTHLRVVAPAIWSRVKVFQFDTNYADTWPSMTLVTNAPDPVVLVCQWSDDTLTWHDLVTQTNDGTHAARFLRVGRRKASEPSMP